MFSNDHYIKLTFHYFYIVFYCSWFIELQLYRYKLLLFLWLFIFQVLFFGGYLSSLSFWLLTCFFAFIGLAFIDPETFSWVLLQIVCGSYPNWTCGFSPSAGLWKVVVKVTVGCSELFASVDWVDWSILSLKFYVRALFCLFLTYVHHVYWVSFHWSWNFSSSVNANFQ